MPVAPKGRRTVAERVGRSKYTQITFAENQKHRVAPKGRRTVAERVGGSKYTQIIFAENRKCPSSRRDGARSQSESGRSKYTQITFAENRKRPSPRRDGARSRSESGEATIRKNYSFAIPPRTTARPAGAHAMQANCRNPRPANDLHTFPVPTDTRDTPRRKIRPPAFDQNRISADPFPPAPPLHEAPPHPHRHTPHTNGVRKESSPHPAYPTGWPVSASRPTVTSYFA